MTDEELKAGEELRKETLRVGCLALAAYDCYVAYRTNTGVYAGEQWKNGRYDDFRYGVPEPFAIAIALIKAGVLPEPK